MENKEFFNHSITELEKTLDYKDNEVFSLTALNENIDESKKLNTVFYQMK